MKIRRGIRPKNGTRVVKRRKRMEIEIEGRHESAVVVAQKLKLKRK